MFFKKKEIDPWEWCFVPSIYGLPLKYNLERGVRYRLKGILGPGSSIRIIDEHGDFVFAAEARSDTPWYLSQPFVMQKDMGDWITIQFCGDATNLHFEWDGINVSEFKA